MSAEATAPVPAPTPTSRLREAGSSGGSAAGDGAGVSAREPATPDRAGAAVDLMSHGTSALPERLWPTLRALFVGAVLLLVLGPFALVLAISFGENIQGADWDWGATLSAYELFFVGINWPEEVSLIYLQKLFYSLYYAVLAAIIAVALAFPFTYLMTRQSRRMQTVWLVFLLSMLSLSEVFIVMGWDILLSNRSGLPMVFRETGLTDWLKEVGWFGTLRDWGLATPRNVRFKPSGFATTLALTHLVWPFAVILLYPALSRIDNAMLEAARTMGAGPWTVVRTVVLPAIRLPLIGAVLLLFVYLLGAYVTITVFAAPPEQTLTVSIYQAVRGATLNAPFGAAQAVVLLVTAALFLGAAQWLSRMAERRGAA
ncbi:MAG: ABC transporter permease subunit [Pseudomonadota bacterium]